MKVEQFFLEQKGITVDAARNAGARYTAIDICRFAKAYHESQYKISAQDKLLQIEGIIESHTEKLNTMKANRAKWEEEKWTDAEIQEADRMISLLASIISDLNRTLGSSVEDDDTSYNRFNTIDEAKTFLNHNKIPTLTGEQIISKMSESQLIKFANFLFYM